MSFRLRLTLFFVIIVVLPMVSLAVLVTQIASDSETGKPDARLSAELHTATTVYAGSNPPASRVANEIAADVASDPEASAALRSGSPAELHALARTYAGRDDAVAVRFTDSSGNRATVGAVTVAKVDSGGDATWHATGVARAKGPLTCSISGVSRTAVP